MHLRTVTKPMRAAQTQQRFPTYGGTQTLTRPWQTTETTLCVSGSSPRAGLAKQPQYGGMCVSHAPAGGARPLPGTAGVPHLLVCTCVCACACACACARVCGTYVYANAQVLGSCLMLCVLCVAMPCPLLRPTRVRNVLPADAINPTDCCVACRPRFGLSCCSGTTRTLKVSCRRKNRMRLLSANRLRKLPKSYTRREIAALQTGCVCLLPAYSANRAVAAHHCVLPANSHGQASARTHTDSHALLAVFATHSDLFIFALDPGRSHVVTAV